MALVLEIALIVIAVLYCFLGYRLARILLPICGAVLLFGLYYVLFPQSLGLDDTELLILSASSAVVLYIILFFVKRIAAFIVGLCAAALASLIALSLFGIRSIEIISPIVLALCLMSALLSAVYIRNAVIITTSLFGGSVAAVFGVMLLTNFEVKAGVLGLASSAAGSIAANPLITAVAALGFTVIAILVQFLAFSSKTVLPSKRERESGQSGDIIMHKKGNNSFI